MYRPRDPDRDEDSRLVQEQGIDIVLAGEDTGWGKLQRLVHDASVVVDALLGTGTHLPVQGMLAEILRHVG